MGQSAFRRRERGFHTGCKVLCHLMQVMCATLFSCHVFLEPVSSPSQKTSSTFRFGLSAFSTYLLPHYRSL